MQAPDQLTNISINKMNVSFLCFAACPISLQHSLCHHTITTWPEAAFDKKSTVTLKTLFCILDAGA